LPFILNPMPERNNDAREIFLAAVERYQPAQWSAYLDEACDGDDRLRQRVEQLLRSHQDLGVFVEDAPSVAMPGIPQQQPGATIGCYKLLEQIGEGGMGVVFMADQTEPVRRQVALKIVKAGMDSRQVIARFEAERQALAMMEHNNIARVLDAGTTDQGRPYFVMELVKGIAITEYCDRNRLTPRERLELFIPVCHAIQHAHQKGIIHRDIKPTNVLVTLYDGRPVPKVIDFGIAKATQQPLTEKTMFTQLGQIMGTIEYMSPEQAEMNQLDVDTRSDVYSLGVLLYELLTGTTPITKEQLQNIGLDEIVRTIRTVDPPKPSTRLSQSGAALPSISAVRKMEPAKLSRFVKDDLDWIVMKAIEKDRARRYETASALAADIDRLLRAEAIEARPPSTIYKLQKFAQRNKVLLVALFTIAATLLAASAFSMWSAIRAGKSENLANIRLASEEQAHAEARQAEELATRRLFDSYLAQAQASRWSGRPGQRLNSIDAIRAAAKLLEPLNLGEEARTGLRNEAIAAMTSVDLREGSSWRARKDTEGGVAVSPNLKMFVVDDRLAETPSVVVRRYDSPDTDVLRIPLTQPRVSHSIFSPDGQFIAVTYDIDRAVSVWEITTRKKLLDVEQTAKDFSPDGRWFAVGRTDGAVHIYDLQEGHLVHNYPSGGGAIKALRFSPDCRYLAVVRLDNSIVEIRETAAGAIISRLTASNPSVHKIAWHPLGHFLAAAGWQKIDVWSFPDGDNDPLIILGHESQVGNLQFHPTRQILASDSWDGTTRFWNSVTGDQLLQIRGSFVRFDDSGRWVALCRGLNLIRWEIIAPEACRWEFQGRVFSVAVRHDGRVLALATANGTQIWDLLANEQLATLPIGRTVGVAFHPGDGSLLTSGPNVGVQVWRIDVDQELGRMTVGPPAPFEPELTETGSIGVSDLGETLIVDHCNEEIRKWYATVVHKEGSSHTIHQLKRPYLCQVATSPDGNWVATGNKWGKDVNVWNAASGQHVRRLTTHGSSIPIFSPDNQWIVTNSGDGVRFWEVGSWRPSYAFPASTSTGSAVAFTADSQMAAIARGGQGLLLVDMRSGEPIATLETNARRPRIESLCFTPNGQTIVAAAGERGVYVWDLRAIRERLAELDLDWNMPSVVATTAIEAAQPLRVEVELGRFATADATSTD
jgi:serine/threonine protein kinase/WD40 repeat protein